jgi:hypothetical protein
VRRTIVDASVERANELLAARDQREIARCTPHTLRRTFASILAELNLPPRWAMYLIGHTDPTLTMRVYQQVIDMGEGGLETLEKLIGCTLEEAFALLSGRGVLATNWQPANKNASQPGAWSAGRHGNAVAAGGSSKRLKGLEPSTSMASRPRLNRWIGFLPANRAKQGLWDRRVLSQISPGFDGILSTNCPPRHRADRGPRPRALPHRMEAVAKGRGRSSRWDGGCCAW